MTEQAWIFMILVWILIISQTCYCFWKLLSSPRQLDGEAEDSSEPTASEPKKGDSLHQD